MYNVYTLCLFIANFFEKSDIEGQLLNDIGIFQQEIVVGDHTSDWLKADRGPSIPGSAVALHVEHLPDPSLGHLRGVPAIKVFPVYLLQYLYIVRAKPILVKGP